MNSSKPYLIRAIYEWIVDNNLTPYIAVDTNIPGTAVPKEYIEDERIVLNISPTSVNNLVINNNALEFKARFSGVSHNLYVPTKAVMVIYAQENNRGMAFPPEEFELPEEESDAEETIPSPKGKPQLQLVPGGKDLNTEKK